MDKKIVITYENFVKAGNYLHPVSRNEVMSTKGRYYIKLKKVYPKRDFPNTYEVCNRDEIIKKFGIKGEGQVRARIAELFYLKLIYRFLDSFMKKHPNYPKSQGKVSNIISVCFDNGSHYWFDIYVPRWKLFIDIKSKGVVFSKYSEDINKKDIKDAIPIWFNKDALEKNDKIRKLVTTHPGMEKYNYNIYGAWVSKPDQNENLDTNGKYITHGIALEEVDLDIFNMQHLPIRNGLYGPKKIHSENEI